MRLTAAEIRTLGPRLRLQGSAPKKPAPAKTDRYRNAWEREYARKLEALRLAGQILWWGYEDVKLHLGGGAWVKFDFALIREGNLEFVEVKGHWREAAKVRMKVALAKFPFRIVVAKKVGGRWVEEEVVV